MYRWCAKQFQGKWCFIQGRCLASQLCKPPSCASSNWISALMFSMSKTWTSLLHSGSFPPSMNGSRSSIRLALCLSREDSFNKACTWIALPSLGRSLLLMPSQLILSIVRYLFSWGSAMEPCLYVDKIFMPSGSKSIRAYAGQVRMWLRGNGVVRKCNSARVVISG